MTESPAHVTKLSHASGRNEYPKTCSWTYAIAAHSDSARGIKEMAA